MIDNQHVLLLATMKNEGPYILEWVAHHLSVGVDRFLIFTNHCDDGTDVILEELSKHIDMIHLTNPRVLFPDRSDWHIIASKYAQTLLPYRRAGWIYTTDADEFLQINTEAGTLQSFRDIVGAFDVVSFSSKAFGSDGVVALEDRPVMEQFTRTNFDPLQTDTPLITGVKTLLRNSITYDARRNHRPIHRTFSSSGLRWIDGSGNSLPAEFTDTKIKALDSRETTNYAWYNHYAIKSEDAYLVKMERGDATGSLHRQRSRRYWRGYDAPGAYDTHAAPLRAATREILDEFHRDPILHELHLAAFAYHKTKAHELRLAREQADHEIETDTPESA